MPSPPERARGASGGGDPATPWRACGAPSSSSAHPWPRAGRPRERSRPPGRRWRGVGASRGRWRRSQTAVRAPTRHRGVISTSRCRGARSPRCRGARSPPSSAGPPWPDPELTGRAPDPRQGPRRPPGRPGRHPAVGRRPPHPGVHSRGHVPQGVGPGRCGRTGSSRTRWSRGTFRLSYTGPDVRGMITPVGSDASADLLPRSDRRGQIHHSWPRRTRWQDGAVHVGERERDRPRFPRGSSDHPGSTGVPGARPGRRQAAAGCVPRPVTFVGDDRA